MLLGGGQWSIVIFGYGDENTDVADIGDYNPSHDVRM